MNKITYETIRQNPHILENKIITLTCNQCDKEYQPRKAEMKRAYAFTKNNYPFGKGIPHYPTLSHIINTYMHIARKVKLYPTDEQITPLYKYAGACRFIWNHFLTYATNTYKITKKYPNYKDMSAYLTILKKQKDYSWLNNDAISTSLQKSLNHLISQYHNQ